ncbi:hypothetical protein [Bradyrhizobium sp. DASA03007]|uniref:hypothetical protein n=1 Tax=unclassified Bradyrhizobium TaxID=2631580 RepID=UPI003F6F646B
MLRCYTVAFAAIGGLPREILGDRMKTAVMGEAPRPESLNIIQEAAKRAAHSIQ